MQGLCHGSSRRFSISPQHTERLTQSTPCCTYKHHNQAAQQTGIGLYGKGAVSYLQNTKPAASPPLKPLPHSPAPQFPSSHLPLPPPPTFPHPYVAPPPNIPLKYPQKAPRRKPTGSMVVQGSCQIGGGRMLPATWCWTWEWTGGKELTGSRPCCKTTMCAATGATG